MVIWIIGLSGSGKTTLMNEVLKEVKINSSNIVSIDGDIVREIFDNDLGYGLDDRRKNSDRIAKICKYLSDQNINVICSILSLFHETQKWNRENINNYYEVFIDAPIKQLIKRDTKGLYNKAIRGDLDNVAGIDINFTPPLNPELIIKNNGSVKYLLSFASIIAAKLIKEL